MIKTIMITGATSGFGRAIAALFAKNGFALIITGRRAERLAALKDELEGLYGIKVIVLAFDVRDKQSVGAAFTELKGKVERIDILVNNAGLASGLSPIDEGEIADWDVMIDTNVKGLLYVTRKALDFMKQQGAGHIFNVGSTAGKMAYKNGNVYCATKFAVDALTQSMRIDLLPYNIKVTAINPGMAETEFSIVRFKGDTERAKKVYEGFQALKAEDIADVVYYCATLPPHVCINDLTITATNQANAVFSIKDEQKVNLS
ncbi:MAG TPA: SDR family NAD(P)-dependent oxidoreductase [Flavipsychrobacter sp.]|jgi:NADP-dependent 3-hydroxy acid dehydrogenase YdfG|nr:SDR family NAD(P)-dependent oxidoreductase [Flavipsychrobacter sp.]